LRCHRRLAQGSPDLNPIENLWAIIKARISEIGAETIDDLIQVIIDVGNSVTKEQIANLTYSMPDRLRATVEAGDQANGYSTYLFEKWKNVAQKRYPVDTTFDMVYVSVSILSNRLRDIFFGPLLFP
jgi:hypothetical protein